jgi:hypothetical protein
MAMVFVVIPRLKILSDKSRMSLVYRTTFPRVQTRRGKDPPTQVYMQVVSRVSRSLATHGDTIREGALWTAIFVACLVTTVALISTPANNTLDAWAILLVSVLFSLVIVICTYGAVSLFMARRNSGYRSVDWLADAAKEGGIPIDGGICLEEEEEELFELDDGDIDNDACAMPVLAVASRGEPVAKILEALEMPAMQGSDQITQRLGLVSKDD